MIRRLRRRFVLVTTILLSVLLLLLLAIICRTTWKQLEEDIDTALQTAFVAQQPPGTPQSNLHSYLPCFILRVHSNGQMEVQGHTYYDLTDLDQLAQILLEAQQTGQTKGTLANRQLKFQYRSSPEFEEYVFVDISEQMQALRILGWTCCSVFSIALAIFYALSCLLARWMVRPVEQAWDQQRRFIADASHELKTPLTVILTNAELLQSGEYGEDANQRFTNGIVTMAGQMRGLTETMLELAKADSQPMQDNLSDRLNWSDLTESSVMHFEPVYFEAGRILQAQIQPDIYLRGNSSKLQQVVEILLDNGQKYSTPGSTVTLTLSQSRSHCTLCIRSQGQPLTDQQCKDIFQRFYRVDEARTRNRSYGLGLPIAQSIVLHHRGKIWAQSKDGINAFFVTLPTCNS